MGGQHVDGGVRRSPALVVHIAGGGKTPGELAERHAALQPETTHVVAVMVVPFGEAAGKRPHLIAAGANVPGFGNQLAARQHIVRQHRPEQRRIAIESRRAAEHATQIEAEAVDMALPYPKMQAVHHQPRPAADRAAGYCRSRCR